MLKKPIAVMLTIVMVLSMSFGVFAAIGDICGMACHTDIVAQINGYDIPSYNVDGNTYIVAEDLMNYGFNVTWNMYARTLSISRDSSVKKLYASYKKPAIDKDMVGTKSHDILYTDIVTYADGEYVGSYNINGQTIIQFDELGRYGSLSWDGDKRKISLTISGIENKGIGLENVKTLTGRLYIINDFTDNYGTTYDKTYKLSYRSGSLVWEKATYLLDGKYNRFITTCIQANNMNNGRIEIYAEDELIYEKNLTPEAKPVYIDLNIRGVNKFTIVQKEVVHYNPTLK